jgi:hypothetical protein
VTRTSWNTRQALGVIEALEKQWEPAGRHLNEAVAVQLEIEGSTHPKLILSYLNLAWLHILQQHWAQASEFAAKARAIAEARLGPNHPVMAEILNASATISRKTGHRKEARELDRQVKAILAAQPNDVAARARVYVADLLATAGHTYH